MKTNSIVNNFKRSKPKKVGERFKKDITKMRVALIGSTDYENRGEIKELVWNLKQKVGDDLIIVTRGNKDGVEKWVRKFSLEMGIKYIEYNVTI